MSKYIDADRLRAEIENLIERYSSVKAKGVLQEGYKGGRLIGYEDVLNILKRIQEESEKTIDGLDKEIIKCWQEWLSPSNKQSVDGVLPLSEFAFYARHFAKWGAEHLATSGKTLEIKPGDEVTINGHKIIYDKDKGYVTIVKSEESVPNDLEEAAGKSLRLAGFHNMETIGMDWKGGFIAGAKWQKEQMMKELRSYCLDEIERFQGTDEGSRATREVYYDIIGYLDNYERR